MKNIDKLLLAIIGLFIISLVIKPIGIVFALIFPAVLFVQVNRKNALLSIPLVVLLNFLIFVIGVSLLGLLRIPIIYTTMLGIPALTSVVLIVSRIKWKFPNLNIKPPPKKDLKFIWAIYALFLLAFFARVVSVYDAIIPIMHDPQAHAFWAKKIVDEQTINYFYSPGLHIWSAFEHLSTNISFARATHLTTNFFNSFSVLSWGLFLYLFSRRALYAMIIATFTLLAPLPTLFFTIAGKNALVVAIAILPLGLFAIRNFYEHKNILSSAVTIISLVGLALVHYPTLPYGVAIAALYALYSIFESRQSPSLKVIISKSIWLLLITAFLTAASMLVLYTRQPKFERPASRLSTVEFREAAENTGNIEPAILETIPTTEAKNSALFGALGNNIDGYVRQAIHFLTLTKKFSSIIPGLIFVAGIAIFMARKKDAHLLALTVISGGVAALLPIVAQVSQLKLLSIVGKTGILLTNQFAVLAVALAFYLILRRITYKYILFLITLSVIYVALATTISTARLYEDAQSKKAYVNKYDIQAYGWIKQNLPADAKFINSAFSDPHRKSILFANDGALWLPVFTDAEIAIPFQEVRFSTTQNQINYVYWKFLLSNEKKKRKAAINHFKANGFNYYYYDSYPSLDGSIPKKLRSASFKESYRNDEIIIFRLN